MLSQPRRSVVFATAMLVLPVVTKAQVPAPQSAQIGDIHYTVRFDRQTAMSKALAVSMTFTTGSSETILLSLPSWTPGAYEISNFARNVSGFTAVTDGESVRWDKADYDTWRIFPTEDGVVTLSYSYMADSLDNAMAWAQPDFAFFNGTNVFLYPEGTDLEFASIVTLETEDDWHIATGLTSTGQTGEYTASSFHELVDMPVFVGEFDLDSTRIDGRWYRLATYPEASFQGRERAALWGQLAAMVNVQSEVFGETPWDTYTTLMVFGDRGGSGSALEHSNSHLGIYDDQFSGSPSLALITGHEIFHAWNVKRLRPTELVPYVYDRPQQTTLLWVSEGITDYYADLSLIRAELLPQQAFYLLTNFKLQSVIDAGDIALEDASLSTWISPTDGTSSIYYEKGSLVGLMLDILIRDVTNNAASLDDVLRDLYQQTYKQGRGFTLDEWWQTVERTAGGHSFAWFHDRFIDGREPFPWDSIAPLAGMVFAADTVSGPRIGISTGQSQDGIVVTSTASGSAAQIAGIEPGDLLVRVGEVAVSNETWVERFRLSYNRREEGSTFDVVVRRDGEERTFVLRLQFSDTITHTLSEDPRASFRARRIRSALLTGVVER